MKYTKTLVNAIVKAIENHPTHTFWNVHIRAEFEGYAEIRFENIDGVQMSIFVSDDVIADMITDPERSAHKWFGTAHLAQINRDSLMMWLGIKLDEMHKYYYSEMI